MLHTYIPVWLLVVIVALLCAVPLQASEVSLQGEIVGGRFLVPMRGIFETLGAVVDWDGDTRVATITQGNVVIRVYEASSAPAAQEAKDPAPAVPAGEQIVVNSTADSGTGTLRQALQTARAGDVITFDPQVFTPRAPATIYVRSELPHIRQGNVKVDASNSGVIIDGTYVGSGHVSGLQITSTSCVKQQRRVDSEANLLRMK